MSYTAHKRFVALAMALVLGLVLGACGSDDVQDNDGVNHTQGEGEPCQSDADCGDDDEQCTRSEPGVEGECLPLFEVRTIGESCSNPQQCESGLCYEGECAQECEEAGDCSGDWLCHEAGEGGICEAPGHCDNDGDCPTGGICAFGIDEDEGGLSTYCLPENAGVAVGESCEENDDCLSRACVEGYCSAPCDDDEQCGSLQVCEEDLLSVDGEEGEFEMCVDMPAIACTTPGECDEEMLTCNTVVPDEGAVEGAVCGRVNPDQNELGEECTEAADCESDQCWVSSDGSAGECSVFCQDADQDCADGQICSAKAAGLGMCLASCDRNDDCQGGNVCQLGTDPQFESVHSYCSLQVGDEQTGESCDENSECETGLCLTVITYTVTDQECSSTDACDADYECRCPPDDPECSQQVCVSEEGTVEDRCSELCDPDNGNADCDGGDHEMTWCNDGVETTFGDQSKTVAACSLPLED